MIMVKINSEVNSALITGLMAESEGEREYRGSSLIAGFSSLVVPERRFGFYFKVRLEPYIESYTQPQFKVFFVSVIKRLILRVCDLIEISMATLNPKQYICGRNSAGSSIRDLYTTARRRYYNYLSQV